MQRTPSTEEVALAMRYMAEQHKEISLARRLNTPLTLIERAHDLRLAMTKTLLVEEYLELSKGIYNAIDRARRRRKSLF